MKALALVFVVALIAVVPACDLFGAINCKSEGDCPDNLPFCVSGQCSKTDEDGRDGRGVEGCTADDDCEHGLCDLDGAFVDPGSCLPAADDDTADCAADPDVLGQVRADAAAPVIFNVQATSIGDGCYSGISFDWFQRDPQPVTNAFFELVVGGGNQTLSPPPTGLTDSHVTLDTVCGAQIGKKAGILMNLGGNSNVGCLPTAQ